VLRKATDECINKFGKLDILVRNQLTVFFFLIFCNQVNNVGFTRGSGTIETLKLDDYDQVMNVNVRSIIQLTQLCVPHLIKSKGNIVNVSSVSGSRSFANILAYGMSKAALDQFTKSVALELADKSVRVNSVK
jgi:NAD(P)-dependent dehydrogenase (short-subunit alcohol dehydrogenase family)